MGVADAVLLPQGCCSCGVSEIPDDTQTQYYMKTGKLILIISLYSHYVSDYLFIQANTVETINWIHFLTLTEMIVKVKEKCSLNHGITIYLR